MNSVNKLCVDLKKDCIETIESLYPPDSQFTETAIEGKAILLNILAEKCGDWRDLPISILQEFRDKCIEKERQ